VAPDRPNSNEADAQDSGQVLHFRQRRRAAQQLARVTPAAPDDHKNEPIDDLARYEQEDENDNYRNRMLMNAIAVIVVTLLVGVGVWLADTIAAMQKDQDCVMQGRGNCSPIEFPAPQNRL
jgi:hypothetical protein